MFVNRIVYTKTRITHCLDESVHDINAEALECLFQFTRKGELVFDLDSTHKKPYEPLLIGQFEMPTIGECSFSHSASTDGNGEFVSENHSEKSNDKEYPEMTIPEHQIICSVPCSLHSRKPPLNGTKFFLNFFSSF